MRISISNIAWGSEEEPDILKLLVENNVSCLEIAPTKYWEKPALASSVDIESQKRRINDAGVEVVAAQALFFGRPELSIFGDEKVSKVTFEYLCKISETCIRLGAKALVFGSPKNRLRNGLEKEAAFEIAARFFEDAAIRIYAMGGILCIEPNPVEYGCDFINTTKEAIEFARQINHPGVRIQLDTSAIFLNRENSLESLEKGLAWAGHFHISEPFLKLIGTGETDHHTIASKLRALSFEGTASIEMRSGLAVSNYVAVEKALKFVKKIYS